MNASFAAFMLAVVVPPGFVVDRRAEGLTGATAMAISPDGRLFVCEQTGALRLVKDGRLLAEPFVRLRVDSRWERGLIGVAIDPEFPREPFVYVNYVADAPFPHHRISRFTASGDRADPESEKVLFEGGDQEKLGGSVPSGHQGGAIHFGRDGKLYVALGEQTAGSPSQDLHSLLGKLLRIDRDGSIPADNPFFDRTEGKYRAIWCLGLRNPFGFAVDPLSGRIFLNDVGGNFEEINEAGPGRNFGWPTVEHGPTKDSRFVGPIHWYPTSSITGGAFAPRSGPLPAEWRGRYFFLDFMKGWLRTLDPDRPGDVREFASGLARPTDLAFAPDGSLYVLQRDAWVIDKDFRPGTGSVLRVRFEPGPGTLPERPKDVTIGPVPPFPTFLPPPGRFTGPIRVRITAKSPVRFTLDGSEPSIESPIATGPIPLDRSATLKIRPFRDGQPIGPALTAEYRIGGRTAFGLADRPEAPRLPLSLDPNSWPKRLSEVGAFADLAAMTPAPGFVPFAVNSPLWSDGAAKRRWIALPGGATIEFRPTGEWRFPRGTVFVKHFEMPREGAPPRRLETRITVADGSGLGAAATYRWGEDGRDADLLADGRDEAIATSSDASRRQTWSYPSRDDCLKCHTRAAGFVLGPSARQLNGPFRYPTTGIEDHQIRSWSAQGMFSRAVPDEEIPKLARLSPISDESATVEHRIRSYLDSNCANCHRPGANIPAAFDARWDCPEADRKILDARTVSDGLGIANPRVVAPGDVSRSMIHQRIIQTERYKMPPVGRNVVDRGAADLLAGWIAGLGGSKSK